MSRSNGVTIELRGGDADGRRTTVPAGTTELSVPVEGAAKHLPEGVYRPSGELCDDGVELWDAFEPPEWGETGMAPPSEFL